MINKHIIIKDEFKIDGVGTLDIFALDTSSPMILICPGGGYDHLSTREAMPVVDKFNSLGFNCALLKYSVAPDYHYPTPLNEANASLLYLKSIYENVFIMGFSAGGHLVGLLGTDIYSSLVKGMILCYPVISLEKYSHIGSRNNLLGEINNIENQIKFSIHNRVNSFTPPTFIWCTKEDQSVPYQNTLMMVDALIKNNIFHQEVIFPHGPHGMALADSSATSNNHPDCKNEEVAIWPNLVKDFIFKVIKYE